MLPTWFPINSLATQALLAYFTTTGNTWS